MFPFLHPTITLVVASAVHVHAASSWPRDSLPVSLDAGLLCLLLTDPITLLKVQCGQTVLLIKFFDGLVVVRKPHLTQMLRLTLDRRL